jgi:hypothetical protein
MRDVLVVFSMAETSALNVWLLTFLTIPGSIPRPSGFDGSLSPGGGGRKEEIKKGGNVEHSTSNVRASSRGDLGDRRWKIED